MTPRLSLAVSDYDHVRDLVSGAVQPRGLSLDVHQLPVGEIFRRVLTERPWDAAEMSMGMYVALLAGGDRGLMAIPVFPSRVFRLSAFYVRTDGPVQRPEDLRGRRVGDPDWAMTAGIYARGWLQHQVGVPLTAIEWVQAGVDAPGRAETLSFHLPPGLRRSSRPDTSLDAMLLSGEVDAVLTAQPPRSFLAGGGAVRRLVPDHAAAEEAYLRETGVFPIMHTIVLRRDVVERHPEAPLALFEAFEAAKRRSLDRMRDIMASRIPLPWGPELARRAEALFGPDPWPYGVAPNRRTLEAFLAFCQEQGVTQERLPTGSMFPGCAEGDWAR